MGQPLTFDLPAFRGGSNDLGDKGTQAGSDLSSGVSSALSPPGASSPVGNQISMLTGQLQVGLSPAGPALSNGATDLNSTTQQGMSSIENQDAQNAAGFQNGGTPGQGLAGSDVAGQLDPKSIDEEAKAKAEEMLGGDQSQQMMQQVMQMGMQTGSQIAQQLSQQLSQIGSKVGEAVGKAGEQVGQLVSKVAESASKSAEVSAPDLGLDGLGAGGGGFGGGGGGGGMDPGTTMPAGLEGPITPMNGSSALQASALQAPGGGSPAGAAGSRLPMMPMMPMHGMHGGNKQGEGESTKRDPAIFPEDKLYDAPQGVEQTFGAIPEIESEEPPFGTAGGSTSSGH
ncbi:hypothetical protein AB4Z39_12495 [Mycobacterium adipatum]|uniref:hypothetical protein n=1 Tax=Mycobacterium adipatum TaxID=1682113 RepID=UPI0034E05E94